MNVWTDRLVAIVGCAALSAVSAPAQAQFGGLLSNLPGKQPANDGCPKGKKKSAGSAVLGGILGQAMGSAASRAGITRWVPISGVSDQLTNAIACRLDPEEQKQAAEATLQATRGGSEEDEVEVEVGSTAAWTSKTREDVSGSSTVVGVDTAAADSMQCISVTDVVIVGGEEATATKRMCRPPGSRRYSLAA